LAEQRLRRHFKSENSAHDAHHFAWIPQNAVMRHEPRFAKVCSMRRAAIADCHGFALPLDRRVHAGSSLLAKHAMACGCTPNRALALVGKLESFAEPRPFSDSHARAISADFHCSVHRIERNHASRATGVEVHFNGQFHVHITKPQLIPRADDAWLPRPQWNSTDEAQAAAVAVDDEPVVLAPLDSYARGTHTWVVDDGVAIDGTTYFDAFVFENKASLGGYGTSWGNDENETHGSSLAEFLILPK
jgi:hypothetical protein